MRVITIGRSQENDVIVNDNRVSRVHLQLVQNDNGNCSVVDLNSGNGTFVNGQQIIGEYFLQPNDSVIIGDFVLPWQNYINPPVGAIDIDLLSESKSKRKNKHAIWFVVAVVLSLLICGGVVWKIYYDKKQKRIEIENKEKEETRLLQEENERKIAEENEANELTRKALISQKETEKTAKEEAQAKEIEAQRRAEANQKKAEEEQKAKEAAQKEEDRTKFDQLKVQAESMKGLGGTPDALITEMKKIAKKYPSDSYFQNSIKKMEN